MPKYEIYLFFKKLYQYVFALNQIKWKFFRYAIFLCTPECITDIHLQFNAQNAIS